MTSLVIEIPNLPTPSPSPTNRPIAPKHPAEPDLATESCKHSYPSSSFSSTTCTTHTDESENSLKLPSKPQRLAKIHLENAKHDDALPEKNPKLQRMFKLPVLSAHRRLIALMAFVNIAVLGIAIANRWWNNLPALANAVLVNITVAVVVRQQRFVNLLFRLATCSKTFFPLKVRWALAKVYHFGGLHSGCSVAATVWLLLFTAAATYQRAADRPSAPSVALLVVTYVIETMLICIVILALPSLRAKFHNSFEVSHRFLGWSVLALVWAHTVLLVNDSKGVAQSLGAAYFSSAGPYLLGLVTLSIVHPWLYLRKVPVEITKPSNHAIIVRFTGVKQAFLGSSSSISLDPLFEWHAFANIAKREEKGFRLVISRAGDWTSRVIDNPPTHFWIRGIPTAGVGNVETLFKSVLYVATGSGIGPIMPHLLANTRPSYLFWSTRTPVETFGTEFVQEIEDACPEAVIHDTVALGKPDMLAETYRLVRDTGAEAVICISNPNLTKKVVYGMESRGIPAFGAIWDS